MNSLHCICKVLFFKSTIVSGKLGKLNRQKTSAVAGVLRVLEDFSLRGG